MPYGTASLSTIALSPNSRPESQVQSVVTTLTRNGCLLLRHSSSHRQTYPTGEPQNPTQPRPLTLHRRKSFPHILFPVRPSRGQNQSNAFGSPLPRDAVVVPDNLRSLARRHHPCLLSRRFCLHLPAQCFQPPSPGAAQVADLRVASPLSAMVAGPAAALYSATAVNCLNTSLLSLSDNVAVQSLLTNIPFFAVGVLGFAVATIMFVCRGMVRYA